MPGEIERLEARRRQLLRDLAQLPRKKLEFSKAKRERARLASKLRHVEDRIFMLVQLSLPL